MSWFDELIDQLTDADRANPYLPQTGEQDDEDKEPDENNLALKKKLHKFYRPDQQRDKGGKFEDEGKGSLEPGYDHPGLVPHHGEEFYSPVDTDMTFDGALAAMRGERQQAALTVTRNVDSQLGFDSKPHDAIGDWQDGAENSVVNEISNIRDMSELRYSSALKGKQLHQKAVLAFEEDSNGKDTLYSMAVPSNDIASIRDKLDDAGIQHRTILPEGASTRIMLFDQGDSGNSLEKLKEVASNYENETLKIEVRHGNGEFVGEAEDRAEAGKNYDKIISDYEKKYPSRRHYQQGPGSNGSRDKIALPTSESDIGRFVKDIQAGPDYAAAYSQVTALKNDPILSSYAEATGRPNTVEDWTLAKNSTDGKLSPERQALHDSVVNKLVNPKAVAKAGERPKVVFLIGQPGAGKTTAGRKYIDKYGELTKLNADDIRSYLPEYTGINAPVTQGESKTIFDRAFSKALGQRQNILLDESGWNADKAEQRVNALSDIGYDVHVIHVKVPLEVSMGRTWSRFKGGEKAPDGRIVHRFVDPDYLLNEVDHKTEKTYNALKSNKNVSSWIDIDNTKTPTIIDQGNK